MNAIYVKTLFYCYGKTEEYLRQIDKAVEHKALASFDNFRPCLEQSENILKLTDKKDKIIKLKLLLDKVLLNFSSQERDMLDYKYFKKKPKEYYENAEWFGRTYFRRQIKILHKASCYLKAYGFTDKKFIEICNEIDYFAEALKRTVLLEKALEKNRRTKKNIVVKKEKYVSEVKDLIA